MKTLVIDICVAPRAVEVTGLHEEQVLHSVTDTVEPVGDDEVVQIVVRIGDQPVLAVSDVDVDLRDHDDDAHQPGRQTRA